MQGREGQAVHGIVRPGIAAVRQRAAEMLRHEQRLVGGKARIGGPEPLGHLGERRVGPGRARTLAQPVEPAGEMGWRIGRVAVGQAEAVKGDQARDTLGPRPA
jgi:hypothetical protein